MKNKLAKNLYPNAKEGDIAPIFVAQPEKQRVYIAEEYDGESTWISGVYSTMEAAEESIKDSRAKRNWKIPYGHGDASVQIWELDGKHIDTV